MSTNWLESYRFNIKRPDSVRRSYDIIEDIKSFDRRSQKSIKKIARYSNQASALSTLNKNLKSGLITELEAEVTIRDIIKPQLENIVNRPKRAFSDSVLGSANMTIFKAFWEERYETNKRVIDKERVKNQFLYALRALEPLSLNASEEKDLQRHWDKALSGTAHRRYGRAINTLMKFIDRPIKLILERNDDINIEYITVEEFVKLKAHISDPNLYDAIVTLFCTGVRTGELFALNGRCLKGKNAVFIDKQVDRHGVTRATKNRRKHDAVIIDIGFESIQRWINLDHQTKMDLRHVISHRLGDLSRGILGRRISPHDLRHSYAILLLEKGAPIDRVAQFLGDTIEVTQKHYTGFVVSDFALSSLHALVNR